MKEAVRTMLWQHIRGAEALPKPVFNEFTRNWEPFTAKHPEIQQLIQRGLADALSGLLERLTELQVAPAEQRFRNLLRRSSHILQQVPHKYLANYIGIDPSNFSKFLNSIRIE